MTRKKLFTLASLVAAGAMLGGLAAQAQQQAPQAAPSTPKDAGPPPGGGAPGPEGTRPFPVMFVTSVELIRSTRDGGMDIVRARGLVSSNAWGEPHLLPITRGEGIDGMLDLIFQASAPTDMAPLGPFMQVEAILPIAHGHPYKGIRVRSGYNAVSLKTLPGVAEAAPPKEDCAKCLGKYFQAKGAAAPAGQAAGNVVKEEDLPYPLRIIRPTDGIPSYEYEPNRLTLVISEAGQIVDAAWD
ncbi:hypothetical protein [Reyranella sp.]|jgi:hypothetical protein|uniref:hypothetical protein n=1 Tax=Reyranella sp. TaxID=1929291 RepID=UPI0040350133